MGTLCASGACVVKAGKHVDDFYTGADGGDADANWEELILQAEAVINTTTRKDWVTDHASVKTNFVKILEDACSCLAAIYAINYNMDGYTSKAEVLTMLNVLIDRYNKNISILKEDENKENM